MAQARSDQAGENHKLDRATIVVGISRAAVADDKKTAAPEANKRITSFRKTTEDRAKDKQQFRLWKGLSDTPPKLRSARGLVKSPKSNQIATVRFALAQRKRKIAGALAATRGPGPTVGSAQPGGAASSSSSSAPFSASSEKRQKLQMVGEMPPRPQPPMPKNSPQSNCKRQLVSGRGLSSSILPQQKRGAIASISNNKVLHQPGPQRRAPLPSMFVQYMRARGRAARLAEQRSQAGTSVAVKKEHL